MGIDFLFCAECKLCFPYHYFNYCDTCHQHFRNEKVDGSYFCPKHDNRYDRSLKCGHGDTIYRCDGCFEKFKTLCTSSCSELSSKNTDIDRNP